MTAAEEIARRILPRSDGRFQGRRPALWLLGAVVALKLLMGVNSIIDAAGVAEGADGFPLASYGADGARAVVMLFAMVALGQVVLGVVGLAVLVRYRALVPLMFALLLAEHAARRAIAASYAIARAGDGASASAFNLGLTAVLIAGLLLSLWPRQSGPGEARPGSPR